MTHKYERECWNCGSTDIENKGSYVQCRVCRATWNEVSKTDSLNGLGTKEVLRTANGKKVTSARTPSTAVLRRATRAREEPPPTRKPKLSPGHS